MDFSDNREHEAIREAIGRICADFGDDYWLQRDRDGGFPHELYNALADAGWLGIAMPRNTAARPRHHRGGGHDAADRRARAPAVGRLGGAHEHLRPATRWWCSARRAEARMAAAADRRQGQGLLRRHRAQHRPEHHQAQDARRTRGDHYVVHGPEGLDLDRPGGQQDAAAGAHHPCRGECRRADRRPEPVLHRPRPQRSSRCARSRRWAARRRLEPAVHRRAEGAGGGPHRRGGHAASSTSCTA
jgi:hypothetical protein